MATTKKKTAPYGTVKFSTIDAYHASFNEAVQTKLQQLRKAILQAAPKSVELISYNMPAFKQNTNLIYYAAYQKHIGLYPTAKPLIVFAEELTKFKTSKGAIQFPIDKPLPIALIKKIVRYRVKEDADKQKLKKATTAIRSIIHYHKDGTIWAQGSMHGDTMDGYWKWFRKDGVIMRSGHFEKGQQVGDWTTYDKLGKVYKITKMKPMK